MDELKRFIASNDDFGFEMLVAGTINSHLDVELSHGATYVDPYTLKPRQFDLRFRLVNENRTLSFAVECKNLAPASPLVVCGRSAEAKESFHDIIVSQGPRNISQASIRRTSVHFRSGEFVGKSIQRPGRKGDAEIYEGWSQALASAHDLVVEAAHQGAPHDRSNFSAVFPWLIVPDNTLWKVAFDRQGGMGEPVRTDYCRYYVGHHYKIERTTGQVCLSHIEFMTLTGLKTMLAELRSLRSDWEDWIPQEITGSFVGG